jgi:hypothetical protein
MNALVLANMAKLLPFLIQIGRHNDSSGQSSEFAVKQRLKWKMMSPRKMLSQSLLLHTEWIKRQRLLQVKDVATAAKFVRSIETAAVDSNMSDTFTPGLLVAAGGARVSDTELRVLPPSDHKSFPLPARAQN